VYLQELADGYEAEHIICKWIICYNTDRPHAVLDKRTPGEAFFDGEEMMKAV